MLERRDEKVYWKGRLLEGVTLIKFTPHISTDPTPSPRPLRAEMTLRIYGNHVALLDAIADHLNDPVPTSNQEITPDLALIPLSTLADVISKRADAMILALYRAHSPVKAEDEWFVNGSVMTCRGLAATVLHRLMNTEESRG